MNIIDEINERVARDKEEGKKKLVAVDIGIKELKIRNTALIKLDKEQRSMLSKALEKDEIVGFEYDGGDNLGIILK